MRLFSIVVFTIIVVAFLPASSSALFLGPYSGQVLDSQTEEPISGASFHISWVKAQGIPGLGWSSKLINSTLVQTDANGKYEIPFKLVILEFNSFFEETNIIVYQPGYRAYIKKIEGRKADKGFKKKNNIIKLDRIPPNFNHKAHYEMIDDALWRNAWGMMDVIPPKAGVIRSDVDDPSSKKDTRVAWDLFLEKALLSQSKKAFLRRVEWENRR